MKNINSIIEKNFNANIEYIKNNHIKLFEKLSAYESAVDNGHYIEKYELIHEDNGFDVLENTTNNKLYNSNISQHTNSAVSSVNKNLDNNLFECFARQTFTKKDLETIQKKNPLETHHIYIAPIIEYIQSNQSKNQELTSFDKFIFFGTGLGSHINSIHNKIKAKFYFIVEDDLELFRLSLFCTDYSKIAQESTLYFSIFEDNDEFAISCESFIKNTYYLNHYIKYFHMISHNDNKYNQFHLAITNQPHIRFLFHDLLNSYIRPLSYFSKKYKFLQKSLKFSVEQFKNKPFLLLASGPSLQKNIEWLEQNHHLFTIVAVSSSLSYLEQHKIKPDIITHADPFKPSLVSFQKLKSIDFIKDSLLFLTSSIDSHVVDLLIKENIYFFEIGSNYQQNSLKLSAPCVGSLSYMLLILLKVEKFYVLGLDLAIDSKTGKDHTDTHQSTKKLNLKEDAFDDIMNYKNSVFNIEGNFEQNVLTTPHFFSSVQIINRYYKQLVDPNQHIFNLSNGAKYNSATSVYPKNIDLSKYCKINTQLLKETTEANATALLSEDDIQRIQKKLQFAREIKNLLETQKVNINNPTEYIAYILKITTSEDMVQEYELSKVLESFFMYIMEYIYFFLNNSEITSKDFFYLDNILKENIFKLIDIYIQTLTNIMEK